MIKQETVKEKKDATEKTVAREICKSILDFGVNQKQIVYIIRLLSLELENKTLMDSIVELTKEDSVQYQGSKIYT